MNAKYLRTALLLSAALTLVLGFGLNQFQTDSPSAEATVESHESNLDLLASWPPPAPQPDPGYEYVGIDPIDGRWAWIYEEINGEDWYYILIP